MATLTAHGGGCCGMRHIYGFREIQETNVADLTRLTAGNEGNSNLQFEVILSDRQTRENPLLVDELARLGYVYTSSWTGQHATPVHLFLRARNRLALSSANFYNRWVNDNNGMLPHPSLAGPLPALAEIRRTPVVLPLGAQRVAEQNNLLAGDRVRVNSPTSRYHNEEAMIIRFSGDRWGGFSGVLNINHNGRLAEIRVTNLVRIFDNPEAGPPVAPPPPPLPYRHPTNPHGWPLPAQAPAAVPAGFPRRLILSQFYCVFRNTGQASRVFETMAAGQEAYPRATQWFERKVYSDGEIVEGPVNHG